MKKNQKAKQNQQNKGRILQAIKEPEDLKNKLIDTFAGLTLEAYSIFSNSNSNNNRPEILAGIFENLLEQEFTKEASQGEEGDAQGIRGMVTIKEK